MGVRFAQSTDVAEWANASNDRCYLRRPQQMRKQDVSEEIERAIADDDWEAARQLIKAALEKEPDSHWLLSRLALTHYEQRDYVRALEIDKQALAIEPACPLSLWGYAGTLEMLDRPQDALAVFERITERGLDSLAYDQCGEGRARARGLYADCLYRISHCYLALGNRDKATELLKAHLQQRGPGCQSIYPISTVRDEMRRLGC